MQMQEFPQCKIQRRELQYLFFLIAAAIAWGQGMRNDWNEKQLQNFVDRLTWYAEP